MKIQVHKIRLISYIITLALSLVFASFYGGPVPYLWLYAIILLIPLSIVYTILNYKSLCIYQEIEVHKLTKGETHNYRVMFENAGLLPIYKMGIFTLKDRCKLFEINDGTLLTLDCHEKKELKSGISCSYAGAYNVGIEKISLSDPFGIYTVELDIPYSFRAIVRPQITDLANEILEIENIVNNTGLKSDRIYEDIPGNDIRPYRSGDSLNSINWKVSAKLSELMVRTPERMEKRTVTILLQAAKEPDSKIDIDYLKQRDFFLEFIVSAAWHFGQQSVPVRFIYPSGQITEFTVNSHESFMEFYSLVADGIFYSNQSVIDELKGMALDRKTKDYEGNTWIILKEAPEASEQFYTICD